MKYHQDRVSVLVTDRWTFVILLLLLRFKSHISGRLWVETMLTHQKDPLREK